MNKKQYLQALLYYLYTHPSITLCIIGLIIMAVGLVLGEVDTQGLTGMWLLVLGIAVIFIGTCLKDEKENEQWQEEKIMKSAKKEN